MNYRLAIRLGRRANARMLRWVFEDLMPFLETAPDDVGITLERAVGDGDRRQMNRRVAERRVVEGYPVDELERRRTERRGPERRSPG